MFLETKLAVDSHLADAEYKTTTVALGRALHLLIHPVFGGFAGGAGGASAAEVCNFS
jgi:hypothetical protein